MSPQSKYWGTCPPCPIGIDAPDIYQLSSVQFIELIAFSIPEQLLTTFPLKM